MNVTQELKLEEQKRFVEILSDLSGRPPTSGLHVHPLFKSPDNEAIDDAGNFDRNVYVVSNRAQIKLYKEMPHRNTVTDAAVGWHTDITFEHIPADYSCLIMRVVPPSGGDTFLEELTATFAQPVFMQSANRGKFDVMTPRGSPLNSGTEFSAIHPVVRHKWSPNDVAIWDKPDVGDGVRFGNRVTTVGEKPYLEK
ncbi:hypothetical protein Clacol_000763 [Clathrus columnatus]|uniref:TauD/TfdA-like domain-containing protein n=1 Tax=Clathrus columnatus TaxID=1419009 RepID=A0AAV4ZXQ0_9AGAM|nr:hypothetical protein Clacol_000763 [Clathrus columnatus]